MSLTLIQGYSSQEEEEQKEEDSIEEHNNFSDNETEITNSKNDTVSLFPSSNKYNPIIAPKSSSLPSALDAFSEISGPPQFLNNCVKDQSFGRDDVVYHGRRKSRDKKDLPSGAVVEAKPHLVGIHERVRSDEGTQKTPSTSAKDSQPRICLQCGIPTTYSSGLGMICLVCNDDSKKKGSTIKDKEKVKRMRGQSSHASWKSETEMHLRQQFD